MERVIWIVFAHLVGDYGLQSSWMAKSKVESWYVLVVVHSMMWAGCVSVALVYFDRFAVWKFIVLALSHAVIDWWKESRRNLFAAGTALFIDQTLHVGICLLCLR